MTMRIAALALIASVVFAAPPAKAPKASRNVRVPISWSYQGDAPAVKGADFLVATDAGGEGRVLRVRSPKDDLMLLVVLDVTGDLALVDPARSTLVEQIRELPKNSWVGVLRAQDGLQVLLDPTADRDKLAEVIRSVPITGKSGLLNTVETAAQLADAVAAKSSVRVAVLYVTDSEVRNYREDFTNPVINESDHRDLSRRFPEGLIREKISKLAAALSASQTPVFIAHLDYSRERLDEAYQSGLMQLASATGGHAVFARSQAEIPDMIARMVTNIQSQYSLLVQLPPKAANVVNLSIQSNGKQLEYRSRFALR